MSSDRSTSEAASHATTSSTSFYELISLPPEYHPTPTQPIPPPIPPALLRKTYRKTSLLYHPDKNPSPDAAATFHTLTTAYDVLSDAATKQAYDQALVARLVRKRKTEVMDGARRRLKEELEARERAAASSGFGGMGWKKQKTNDDEEDEQEFQRKLAQLQQEGAKLRQKREEALRKAEMEAQEEEEEEERNNADQKENSTTTTTTSTTSNSNSTSSQQAEESRFTDLDKTIFLKLLTSPTTSPTTLTEDTLTATLSTAFGEITSCLIRHPPSLSTDTKKKSSKKKKEPLATAVVQFKSIISSHHLIHSFRNSSPPPLTIDPSLWERIRDVKWASGKEPDLTGIKLPSPVPSDSTTQPPLPSKITVTPPTPTPPPSSSSSSPATQPTPRFSFRPTPPTTNSNTSSTAESTRPQISSTDYESVTLMRMREMERKLIEAEIIAQEAAVEEAERLQKIQAGVGL